MDLNLVARNALFNVVRLGSGFLLLLTLPYLVRRLEPAEYNAWTIALQVPTYVNLLGSGVMVALVRLVAARSGADERATVVHSGVSTMRRFALLAAGAVLIAAIATPWVFGDLPTGLAGTARWMVLTIGVGSALSLLGVPFVAYHNGTQDNAGSAMLTFVARAAGAIAVVALVDAGLVAMATAVAASLVAGAAAQFVLYRRRIGRRRAVIDTAVRNEVRGYVMTYLLWSAVNLMTTGSDIVVVGALDFERVGAFGAAAAVAAIVSGLHAALMSAFLPDASRLPSEAPAEHFGESPIMAAARAGGLLSWLSVAGVLVAGRQMLELVFGEDVGGPAFSILLALTIGRGIGNLIWPYVVGVLAVGEHRAIRFTPLVEGVLNLAVSIVLVVWIGAVGAAIGTVIASIVAVLMHLVVNVPRTPTVEFDRRRWFAVGVVRPAAAVAPLACSGVVLQVAPMSVGLVAAAVGAALSGVLVVREATSLR